MARYVSGHNKNKMGSGVNRHRESGIKKRSDGKTAEISLTYTKAHGGSNVKSAKTRKGGDGDYVRAYGSQGKPKPRKSTGNHIGKKKPGVRERTGIGQVQDAVSDLLGLNARMRNNAIKGLGGSGPISHGIDKNLPWSMQPEGARVRGMDGMFHPVSEVPYDRAADFSGPAHDYKYDPFVYRALLDLPTAAAYKEDQWAGRNRSGKWYTPVGRGISDFAGGVGDFFQSEGRWAADRREQPEPRRDPRRDAFG